jgi:hypothetical protein
MRKLIAFDDDTAAKLKQLARATGWRHFRSWRMKPSPTS